ncbi:Protein RFT1-like [Symbiodinium microadriaticum]|uniref:Protein RFT1 homolog n=1 Tax=Symbiodinium microadriaticum TaxID=2951 RepID=A0A1Q9F516_SYMMI|nr:Protein RFT1-like [Symbiodinium microadriaticum]
MALRHHRALLIEFAGMVVLKLALTEGEKMLLLVLFTERDWGVFGLVSNLGSIVLRLLFAPIEEIAYSVFSAGDAKNTRDTQTTMLRALLLLQGGVGWLGLCYGPHFAALAVRLLYGQSWADSEAPSVLAAYCVFLFCSAANGILEAFMYSQCPPEWVRQCNFWQVEGGLDAEPVESAEGVCRSWGPVALVLANSLAMLLRSALGLAFAGRHLEPSFAQLSLGPVAKLLGLLLAGSLASWLVPPVGSPLRICLAVLVAALSISLSLAVCRHELLATVRAVRRSKVSLSDVKGPRLHVSSPAAGSNCQQGRQPLQLPRALKLCQPPLMQGRQGADELDAAVAAEQLRHEESGTEPCAVCGGPTVLCCSGCEEVFYCSVNCQQKDWASHRLHCHRRADQVAQQAQGQSSRSPVFVVLKSV